MIKQKNLFIFTYDYPFIGNDSQFIKDEINYLSLNFKKIYLIPLKKNKKVIPNLKKNIFLDFGLIEEIYDLKNFLKKIKNIFFCKYFWKELININLNSTFKKVKMIILERYIAECIYFFVKKIKNNYTNIFYSVWSNHSLVGLYFLKKKKIINNCFSRILGSDLKGFIPKDKYIAYKDIKFKNLDLVIVLNDEQKKIILNQNPVLKNKVIKNYLGINTSEKFKPYFKKNVINFISCGRLVHVKNSLEILRFIIFFSKANPNFKINYYCIGSGPDENKIKNYFNDNQIFNLNFKHINYIPSLVNFIKKKKINFFLNFSYSEGMSFAIMEALSCSIPIICSNIKGNTEIINNQNGYIIKSFSNDSYKILSSKIINDINDKQYFIKSQKSFKLSKQKISRKKNQKKLILILKKFFES
jgi:glycosyltransferase involved in cell wall biosynthesis